MAATGADVQIPLRRWLFAAALAVILLLGLLLPPPALGVEAGESVADGASLFSAHCVGCHVNGGNIIRRGKTLRLAALERNGIADPAAIALIAAEGIGRMSGYSEVLGEGGPELVGTWVWQQALEGWPRS